LNSPERTLPERSEVHVVGRGFGKSRLLDNVSLRWDQFEDNRPTLAALPIGRGLDGVAGTFEFTEEAHPFSASRLKN
jgi:hypothetical protein